MNHSSCVVLYLRPTLDIKASGCSWLWVTPQTFRTMLCSTLSSQSNCPEPNICFAGSHVVVCLFRMNQFLGSPFSQPSRNRFHVAENRPLKSTAAGCPEMWDTYEIQYCCIAGGLQYHLVLASSFFSISSPSALTSLSTS